VTGADEVVLEPEVAQECDEHGGATLTGRLVDGVDKAVKVMRPRLSGDT
jgi:hypothetical protein